MSVNGNAYVVETQAGRAPMPAELLEQLEESLQMRSLLENRTRENHQLRLRVDEIEQSSRKDCLKSLQALVSTVDELRRQSQAVVSAQGGAKRPANSFWRKPTAAKDDRAEWFDVFQRIIAMATDKLEAMDVACVPLLGQDLQALEYEGQPVLRWVSVKKRTSENRLIVTDEILGLWVGKIGGKLTPIQRGEVIA
jgi:hypothetical protein